MSEPSVVQPSPEAPSASSWSSHLPLALFLLAIAAAAVLRLAELTRRPLHHDEGVNALFLLDLIRDGRYRYDPSNYHGPLLYFMVGPLLWLFGEATFLLRLWPALIGIATLGLFWPLRPAIGTWGAVVAAWLLALSPISVYFSRDLIHESWFTGAGALVGGSIAAYAVTRRGTYLVLAWLGLAALIATKETAPILLAALAGGGVVAGLFAAGKRAPVRLLEDFRANRQWHAIGFIATFWILLLLFTSFRPVVFAEGTWMPQWNLDGFFDMFKAYAFWTKTGTAGAGHEKPWPYFFGILWRYERPLWLLGLGGLGLALARREAAVATGTAAACLLVAHSVIPYKTPWLVMAALPWLAASAGYLVDRAVGALEGRRRWMPLLIVGLLLPALGREAYRVSFVDYDDDSESFVYSQTMRGFLELVQAVEAAAAASPAGRELPVNVTSPDHFPLNWYTREFTGMSYQDDPGEIDLDGLFIATRKQVSRLRSTFEGGYYARSFPLRPGVPVELLVPAALFEKARPGMPEPEAWSRVLPTEILEGVPPREAPHEPQVGLAARAYPGADFAAPPGPVESGRPVEVDYDHGHNDEWTPPHAIEWSGFIDIAADGLYRFVLDSDDGSSLEIDGILVVDNWGQHALQRQVGRVRLIAGLHAVRLRYTDYGGGAKLKWKWRPPGSSSDTAVPITVLSHDAQPRGSSRDSFSSPPSVP